MTIEAADNRPIQAVILDWNWTMVDGNKLFPEVRRALRRLKKQNIQIAVVSAGNNPDEKRADFKRLRLGSYISIFHVVESGARKDFDPILEQLGVDAQRCAVIGDRVNRELEEGRIAGCGARIWVRRGAYVDEIPAKPQEVPDYQIPNLTLLPQIIRELNRSKPQVMR